MTSVTPAPRPSPCPSDKQELASHSQSPVTREAVTGLVAGERKPAKVLALRRRKSA